MPQTFGELDRAFRGHSDFGDVGLDGFGVRGFGGDQLAVVDDHGEQVPEIVDEYPIAVWSLRPAAYSRFTSRHVFTSPSRWYPSSSSTLRAIARPRPASLDGGGIARVS